ncbi:heme lyase CcmF/NrfE family subunit [Phytoactinopolyspora halotolerans]|uniref:Heme lyase CcmF/NrfE family subunit n=1 Tax=Phytoactinopolyspora halotolerans TaxID=1981512 RepID=A0A6L9SBW2_9ACTN|nr:cytochrome c-type biogenesis CcmF C-terminal domain-containing protein [Phytoactinopolyspora halotolerans]NEE02018.1 heme lyase CcmF/NrfE family subunit [Phytoactinopolyspora halotolerans]
MTPALGTAALTAAGFFGVVAAGMWVRVSRRSVARRTARWCTAGAWLAALAAVLLMEWALLSNDVSVAFVAETGRSDLPVYYAVTALWAGAGGSLILWLLVLSTFTVAVGRWGRSAGAVPHAVAMAVLTGLVGVFAVLTQFGMAPFDAVDAVPDDGPGPNPLLRDHPAMGIHPPMLYAGFAGLAVPFALAVGALTGGRVDGRWARAVRPWTLAAWIFLTAGVALGAWWSYAVLGWGGYWAWDPVENVSLMPWLLATALLHLLRVPRHTRGWAAGAVTLAGAAFLLVILGTLLTRSGALLSVHSFSDSPLGVPLLMVFVVASVGWVALLAARRNRLGADAEAVSGLLSRESALYGQMALLALITAVIFAGTVAPVITELISGDRLSIGAPWFNLTTGPPALALLLLMAVGPLTSWGRDSVGGVAPRFRWPAAAALPAIGLAGVSGAEGVLIPMTAGVAVFVVVSLAQEVGASASRRRIGAFIAHAGVALTALAIVASGNGSSQQTTVAAGESVTSGSASATLLGVGSFADGEGGARASARVLLSDGGEPVATVEPELRLFPGQSTVTAAPANVSGIGQDLQVAVLEVDPERGTATLRLTVTPMLVWLWVGAAVIAAGGVIAAMPGPRRRGSRPAVPASQGERAPRPEKTPERAPEKTPEQAPEQAVVQELSR